MNTTPYPTVIPVGAKWAIPFALTQSDNVTPYDYTGHVLRFFLSDTQADTGVYVVTKGTDDAGISPVSPTGGTGNVNLLPTDPIAGRAYYGSIWDETAQIPLWASVMTFGNVPGH